MSVLPMLAVSLLLGGAMGWAYFQALWAAVRRLPRSRPGGFLLALIARLALAIAGFTFVASWAGWPGLGCALAGFLLARIAMVRRVRTAAVQL